MLRVVICLLLVSILALWILSVTVLGLATAIRDDLAVITLATEETTIGEFYLKLFFPVIFPIVITVSCFIFVIGCIGYCGVFTNSQVLLGWFFFSLLVMFCVELSAGMWKIIEYDLKFNDTDVKQLATNIEFYSSRESVPVWFEEAWAEIHERFECCGAESYADWINQKVDMLYMVTTCCPSEVCTVFDVPQKGCGRDLLSYASSSIYMQIMLYITCIAGIIQVLSMVFTLKIWLDFCAKTNQNARNDEIKIVGNVAGLHDNKESIYELELDQKNGRSCYLAPFINSKNNRFYSYSSTRDGSGVTPHYFFRVNHVNSPEADKDRESEFVSEETSQETSGEPGGESMETRGFESKCTKAGKLRSSHNQPCSSLSCRTKVLEKPGFHNQKQLSKKQKETTGSNCDVVVHERSSEHCCSRCSSSSHIHPLIEKTKSLNDFTRSNPKHVTRTAAKAKKISEKPSNSNEKFVNKNCHSKTECTEVH